MFSTPLRPTPVRWIELAALVYTDVAAAPRSFLDTLNQLDSFAAESASNVKLASQYARILRDIAEKCQEWPSDVWSRFFPPWLHSGKPMRISALEEEACVVLYAMGARQLQLALADLNLASPQASREHALETGASAVPSVHAKAAYSKAVSALELVALCKLLTPPLRRPIIDLDAAAEGAEFVAAACKYFFVLLSESSAGKHSIVAKVAAAAAVKQCPAIVGTGLSTLPAVLLAAAYRHLAEAAYTADKVPDMRIVLGHIQIAGETLAAVSKKRQAEVTKALGASSRPDMLSEFETQLGKDIAALRTKYEFENEHVYYAKPAPVADLTDIGVLAAAVPPIAVNAALPECAQSDQVAQGFPLWQSIDAANAGAKNAKALRAEREAAAARLQTTLVEASKWIPHNKDLLSGLASLCRLLSGTTLAEGCSAAVVAVQRETVELQKAVDALRERQVAVVGRALPHGDSVWEEWSGRCDDFLEQMGVFQSQCHKDTTPLWQLALSSAESVAAAAFPTSRLLHQAVERAQSNPADPTTDVVAIMNSRKTESAAESAAVSVVSDAVRLITLSRRLVADVRVAALELRAQAAKVLPQAAALTDSPVFASPSQQAAKPKAPRGKAAKGAPFPEAVEVGEGLLKRLRGSSNPRPSS